MLHPGDRRLSRAVADIAQPLRGAASDYDGLLDSIGDRPLVLLGEATHGTHEFYRARAVITRRLIREKGFHAVAVESDWPDAYRVNRFVRGASEDVEAIAALADFERFPVWMWRNADVLDFVGWLREHNEALPPEARAGFYGLDLYSLHRSIRAVLACLDRIDPEAANRARYRYSCFEDFGEEPQAYGYAASFGLSPSCEREVVAQLGEIQRRGSELAQRDRRLAADEFFFAEQNARLVKNAEEYYRALFQGRVSSWNLRDRHMAETLEALLDHLERNYGAGKMVVWEHNSHVGDARATEMGEQGESNVGQLTRGSFTARKASGSAITSGRGFRNSSPPWYISIRHARSSRSSAPLSGNEGKSRRHSRRGFRKGVQSCLHARFRAANGGSSSISSAEITRVG